MSKLVDTWRCQPAISICGRSISVWFWCLADAMVVAMTSQKGCQIFTLQVRNPFLRMERARYALTHSLEGSHVAG